MKYTFRCEICRKIAEIDIKLADYDTEKENQICACGGKMKRVIEWHGYAKGSGAGWCGNSTGNAI